MFEGKQLRSNWDDTNNKWWFSVIDICAILLDTDYQKARNYWKWLKNKLMTQGAQLVSETNQLRMLALDGKYRYTDVMSAQDIFSLIQEIPSKKAEPFRKWFKNVAKLEERLINAVEKSAGKTADEIKKGPKRPGFLMTYRVIKVFTFENDEEDNEGEDELPMHSYSMAA